MTLRTLWREAPRSHKLLIGILVAIDAVAIAAVVLATGVHYGDWWAVAILVPLVIAMCLTHLAFYRWQVLRERRRRAEADSRQWSETDRAYAAIVDGTARAGQKPPEPRLPDPGMPERHW